MKSNTRLSRQRLALLLRRRTSGGRYLPAIDGLRFLAITPVVIFHLAERVIRGLENRGTVSAQDETLLDWLPSGPLGVVFFVISGFIICLPLATAATVEPDRSPAFSYGAYIRRRLTRLEPPYVIVLTVTLIGVIAISVLGLDSLTEGTRSFGSGSAPLPLSYLTSLVYMHGIVFQEFPRLLPPAWSLEIEFQFYILAPLLILLFLAIGRRRAGFAGEVIGLVLVVSVMKAVVIWLAPEELERFLVTNYMEYFAVGFILSRLFARGDLAVDWLRRLATPLFLGGIALALVADHLRDVSTGSTGALVRLALVAAFAAMFAGALSGGVGQRFTSAPTISTIGGMAYSIYLLHLLYLQVSVSILGRVIPIDGLAPGLLVYGALVLPPLLVLCAAFFLLVEKPCMDPSWPQKLWRATGGRERQAA